MPDTNTPGSTSVDKNKQQQQSAGRMGTNTPNQGADKNRPNPQDANRQNQGNQQQNKDQTKKPSSY